MLTECLSHRLRPLVRKATRAALRGAEEDAKARASAAISRQRMAYKERMKEAA